jgi:hypothetical protein
MKKPKAQRPGFWNADKTSGETKDKEIFCPKSGREIIAVLEICHNPKITRDRNDSTNCFAGQSFCLIRLCLVNNDPTSFPSTPPDSGI